MHSSSHQCHNCSVNTVPQPALTAALQEEHTANLSAVTTSAAGSMTHPVTCVIIVVLLLLMLQCPPCGVLF